MLFRKAVAVLLKRLRNPCVVLVGKNAEILSVKVVGTYIYHCDLTL
jgi:hypothetical protein